MLCVANGTIHAAAGGQPFDGDILIKDGKIVKLGANLASEANEVIDAAGLQVYPGLVEAHSHLGLSGYAVRYEGQDYNELTDSITPQLEALDAFNPQDETIKMAALGGVTTVGTGPGSSNILGGTFIVVKTAGNRVDDMLLLRKAAMKCAFGENPKFCYKEKDNSSRMSAASKFRNILNKTKEYLAKREAADAAGDVLKRPAFDEKLEAMIPVIKGEIPLKAHAHRADDIFTALRIAREFGLKITIEHCTDGHLIADYLARENVPLAIGPSFGHATKYELRNKTFETPGILAKAGCQVSIITDAPVIPQQYLSLCAALAVKSGMDKDDALRAITINPAKHLGVEHRVGTLEAGKDADIILTTGDLFALDTVIHTVLIDGVRVRE
jgi:imidazolonepropionase-like amidohydrolase